MITQRDIDTGIEVLKSLGATRVLLFGSSLRGLESARDLDLACSGIPPARFYYAIGLLLERVGKPVDLVDLDRKDRIADHIARHGKVIYDACRTG